MNETEYDVSDLREIKVMFDNDLVRKVNMEIDEFMGILGVVNSNKRKVFQYVMKKSNEYKSTTRKIADAFKLINSYSYARISYTRSSFFSIGKKTSIQAFIFESL